MVSYKFPPVYSGYGNQAYAVISEISRQCSDTQFIVLTWDFGNHCHPASNSTLIKLGYPSIKKSDYLKTIIFGLLVFKWLVLNRKNYQIIHCLSSFSHAVFVIAAGKLAGRPVMLKVTQTEMKPFYSKGSGNLFLRRLRQKFMRFADLFIATSEDIVEDLTTHGIDYSRIKKIPNGVDSSVFKPLGDQEKENLRTKLNIPLHMVVLLYAGALSERKGIKDLIKAVEMNNYRVPLLLIICGPDYEYKEKLLEDIERIGKNKNVQVSYEGLVSNMHEYFGAADIFVLPSYAEGLSNALLEAAMSGLALVASDIGGNRDVVQDDINGYLFSPGDTRQLAALIDKLVHDPVKYKRMGQSASKKARREYSLFKVAERYREIYRSLDGR